MSEVASVGPADEPTTRPRRVELAKQGRGRRRARPSPAEPTAVSAGNVGFVAGLLGFLEDPVAPARQDTRPEPNDATAPSAPAVAIESPSSEPPAVPPPPARPDGTDGIDAPAAVVEPVWDWAARGEDVDPRPDDPPGRQPTAPDHDLVLELTSFDPQRRRDALRRMLGERLTGATATAAAVALRDPEPDIRHLALQLFEHAPQLLPLDSLEALAFDTDAAVRLRAAALAGRIDDPDVVLHLADRLLTERDDAVLETVLASVIGVSRSVGLGETHVDGLCRAIGQVAVSHLGALRSGLQTLAASLDAGDLLHRLGSHDPDLRAGAAVLAFESGTDTALAAVARLSTDGHPTARRYANAAVAASRAPADVAPTTAPAGSSTDLPQARGETRRSERAAPGEAELTMLPGLVAALGDPDPAIRDQAGASLAGIDRDKLLAWMWTQSRHADAAELERLIDAAGRLEAAEIGEPLARAVLRVRSAGDSVTLELAARSFEPLATVASRWQGSDNPADRVRAVELWTVLASAGPAPLLDLLDDSNANVRLAAVAAVVETGSDAPTVERLLDLIERDSSLRVRQAALAALHASSPAERVTAVRIALSTPHPDLRRASLDLLGGETDDEFHLLTAALADPDGGVAQRAAAVLMERPRPETLAVLWSQLRTASGASRVLLLDVLRNLDAAALRRLGTQAASHPDPGERIVGVTALAALGDEREVSRLVDALGDPTPAVRLAALEALGSHAGVTALAPVLAALRDPEPSVRASAVRVLADFEDDAAIPHVVGALDDPAPLVRDAVVEVLGRHGSPQVAALLLGHLDRPAHQTTVAQLLARMGPAATEALLARIPDADRTQRIVLLQALRAAGITDRLTGELQAPAPDVRLRALELLALLHHTEAADSIADRLTDPDARVRALAATILGDFGDDRAIDCLRAAFGSDPDMEVVAAVERAFRQLVTDE
ncbi:MAG: HEAT repeat domain-containing protein [Actinobacteria bacterium]|jgi:HEAT repeat protein|nr:HEAT repeat domain-containing protein [Actinomycetota bacterium]